MKVGDLVRWIGFPGASIPPDKTGPTALGIIVDLKKNKILMRTPEKLDVAWGDGTFGQNLYPQTVEIISKTEDSNEDDRFTWD